MRLFSTYAYLWKEKECKAHMRLFLRCAYYWGALIYECIQYWSKRSETQWQELEIRDETDPTQNWLKCTEISCNRSIGTPVPEWQRPTPLMQRNIFSLDLHWSQRWQNLDQNWLKLANWLCSHIPWSKFQFKVEHLGGTSKNNIWSIYLWWGQCWSCHTWKCTQTTVSMTIK